MGERVCFIGLGYIGLPTAIVAARNGYNVTGLDINSTVVEKVNRGELHFYEPGLDKLLEEVIKDEKLKATTQITEQFDYYIIVVPTPFKDNHQPDISYILSATETICPFLKKNDLIILESTSPVGTTEKVYNLIIQLRPDLKGKINLAYCPERVLPGNIIYELEHNDRVIGGINPVSTKMAIDFYSRFVKGEMHSTDAKTAELCKLTENSSRDVRIAFANELSIICEKAGINVWELIELANKHPRVNILTPGCGVGGHCIAVDPYFITSQFPAESKIIGTARDINNYKAFWCAEKIIQAFRDFETQNNKKPIIGLFGLAFKPNIDDLRESPAKYIVHKVLQSIDAEYVRIVEPNIKDHPTMKLTTYKKAFKEVDIACFLVAHSHFKEFQATPDQITFDFCGTTNS